MKRLLALMLAGSLAACASPAAWQVVEVYTDPAVPGGLPDRATVQVRGDTFAGTTPCARIEGAFSLADAHLTLTSVTYGPTADTCGGAARYTHEKVAEVLAPGAEFTVHETGGSERLLVSTAGGLNPPSVRVLQL